MPLSSPMPRSSTWRAIFSIRRRSGGVPSRRGGRPFGRPAGCAFAVRRLLRGSPPGRISRPGGRSRRHPVRQRGRNLQSLRGKRVRGCGRAGPARCGARSVDEERGGQPYPARREDYPDRGRTGARRGHDRGGGRVCRRIPDRPRPGGARYRSAAVSAAWRRRPSSDSSAPGLR